MSEHSCYRGEDNRRYLRHRHTESCAGGIDCTGCQPCPERHCDCRRATHLGYGERTCVACLADARDHLRVIPDLWAAIPDEARHRGVKSGAADLLDEPDREHVEAWERRRIAEAQRHGLMLADLPTDETHPKIVLTSWALMVIESYGDPYDRSDTVAGVADWLDVRLSRLAHDVDGDGLQVADFAELRRDLRRVRRHLEAVLHDGEQVDTGAPCMRCGTAVHRTWGSDHSRDGWRCPRCRRDISEPEYRLAVATVHQAAAKWLTDTAMAERTGVKPGTIRSWARKGLVPKRRDSERTVYSVADVEARAGIKKGA